MVHSSFPGGIRFAGRPIFAWKGQLPFRCDIVNPRFSGQDEKNEFHPVRTGHWFKTIAVMVN